MDRDPPRRVVAGARADDPLDPHVVGRQIGELILELFEIEWLIDGDPDAVDSVCSGAVEMTTLVGVFMFRRVAAGMRNDTRICLPVWRGGAVIRWLGIGQEGLEPRCVLVGTPPA